MVVSTCLSIALFLAVMVAAFFASWMKFAYEPPVTCQFVPLRANDPVCASWTCAESKPAAPAHCTETASTSHAEDFMNCGDVEQPTQKKCKEVLTASVHDDAATRACAYVEGTPFQFAYEGRGGFLEPPDGKQKFDAPDVISLQATMPGGNQATISDYWFCKDYAFGCRPSVNCVEHGCISISATCDGVDTEMSEVECQAARINATYTNASYTSVMSTDGTPTNSELECYNFDEDFKARGVNGTTDWLKAWPDHSTAWDREKWGLLSSFLNLLIILVFGIIYENIARRLNDWENHRTQIEYEDELILKNFAFQVRN